jgi:hypothetical protein
VVVVWVGMVVVPTFDPETLLPVVPVVVFVIVGVFASPGTVSVGVVGSGSAAFLLPPPQAARNGARAVRAATERTLRAVIA